MEREHDTGVHDDLKLMIKDMDKLEKEVWRQHSVTTDPKLKEWCSFSAKSIDTIRTQLQSYIDKSEAAGDVLK